MAYDPFAAQREAGRQAARQQLAGAAQATSNIYGLAWLTHADRSPSYSGYLADRKALLAPKPKTIRQELQQEVNEWLKDVDI